MKKKLLIGFSLIFLVFSFSCEDDTKVKIFEPNITSNKIDFPFNEIDSGKFGVIYRNNGDDPITISLMMLSQGELIENSQNKDFCDEVNAIRKGVSINGILPINFNIPVSPENSVANQNDHPNLISYSFPIGTYMILLMNSDSCSTDNYVIFDVKTNDGIQYMEN